MPQAWPYNFTSMRGLETPIIIKKNNKSNEKLFTIHMLLVKKKLELDFFKSKYNVKIVPCLIVLHKIVQIITKNRVFINHIAYTNAVS